MNNFCLPFFPITRLRAFIKNCVFADANKEEESRSRFVSELSNIKTPSLIASWFLEKFQNELLYIYCIHYIVYIESETTCTSNHNIFYYYLVPSTFNCSTLQKNESQEIILTHKSLWTTAIFVICVHSGNDQHLSIPRKCIKIRSLPTRWKSDSRQC